MKQTRLILRGAKNVTRIIQATRLMPHESASATDCIRLGHVWLRLEKAAERFLELILLYGWMELVRLICMTVFDW